MKNFSLVENNGQLVVVFGYERNAIAYMDYDGKADRDAPAGITGDCFPLAQDNDSILAWHGERKKVNGIEVVRIFWRKR